jgi:hypothetical protein
MADMRLLERTLAATVPLNKARRNFLAKFVVALLRVKSVNLTEVAAAFSGRALPESSYKRIQRFLRLFELPYASVALALVRQAGVPTPFVLTLDRTEWQLGSVWLNVLVVGVAYKGVALPVFWRVLPKKGCASTAEKLEAVGRFVRLFGARSIAFLAADREFADRGLFGYLRGQGIDFRIRVKRNALVANGRGQVVQAFRLFRSQRLGVGLALPTLRKCWGMELHLTGLRLASGDYVIVAARRPGGALGLRPEVGNRDFVRVPQDERLPPRRDARHRPRAAGEVDGAAGARLLLGGGGRRVARGAQAAPGQEAWAAMEELVPAWARLLTAHFMRP